MFKKILAGLFMVISLSVLCAVSAGAESIWTDDYKIDILEDGKSCRIAYYRGDKKNVIIPSEIEGYTVTELDSYLSGANYQVGAFEQKDDIISVTIPDSVKVIGRRVFTNCTSLKSINIPDSITTIGECAFGGCNSLESIIIPDSVTTIGDYAFYDCDSLESIILPDSVTTLGVDVFDECDNLKPVIIPDTVTTSESRYWIDGKLRHDDYLLEILEDGKSCRIVDHYGDDKNVIIPSEIGGYTVTELGSYIKKSHISEYAVGAFEKEGIVSVTIPDSVKIIGTHVFKDCTNLESVTIPDSVTTIGEYAFGRCEKLESIIIPDSVVSIGEEAFFACGLKSITFPQNTKNTLTIGTKAFWGCDELESVSIPRSVKSLELQAFWRCENLKSVHIDSVETIGFGAFDGCANLQTVTISKGLTTIKENAFIDCSNLKSITIPRTLKTIETSAFCFCGKLNDIYYEGSKADWEKIDIDFKPFNFMDYSIGNGMLMELSSTTKHFNSKMPGSSNSSASKTIKAVSGLKAVKYSNKIKLKWNKVDNAKGYIIEQYVDGKWTRITKTARTSFTVKDLDKGTVYKFRIKAYGKNGKKTIYGSYKTFKTKTKE